MQLFLSHQDHAAHPPTSFEVGLLQVDTAWLTEALTVKERYMSLQSSSSKRFRDRNSEDLGNIPRHMEMCFQSTRSALNRKYSELICELGSRFDAGDLAYAKEVVGDIRAVSSFDLRKFAEEHFILPEELVLAADTVVRAQVRFSEDLLLWPQVVKSLRPSGTTPSDKALRNLTQRVALLQLPSAADAWRESEVARVIGDVIAPCCESLADFSESPAVAALRSTRRSLATSVKDGLLEVTVLHLQQMPARVVGDMHQWFAFIVNVSSRPSLAYEAGCESYIDEAERKMDELSSFFKPHVTDCFGNAVDDMPSHCFTFLAVDSKKTKVAMAIPILQMWAAPAIIQTALSYDLMASEWVRMDAAGALTIDDWTPGSPLAKSLVTCMNHVSSLKPTVPIENTNVNQLVATAESMADIIKSAVFAHFERHFLELASGVLEVADKVIIREVWEAAETDPAAFDWEGSFKTMKTAGLFKAFHSAWCKMCNYMCAPEMLCDQLQVPFSSEGICTQLKAPSKVAGSTVWDLLRESIMSCTAMQAGGKKLKDEARSEVIQEARKGLRQYGLVLPCTISKLFCVSGSSLTPSLPSATPLLLKLPQLKWMRRRQRMPRWQRHGLRNHLHRRRLRRRRRLGLPPLLPGLRLLGLQLRRPPPDRELHRRLRRPSPRRRLRQRRSPRPGRRPGPRRLRQRRLY